MSSRIKSPKAMCVTPACRARSTTSRIRGPGLAAVSRPSFPCVRAGGKDTFGKSQLLAIYDVKLEKYFANRVANLAKRQSTRSGAPLSLHRCTTLHLVACNAVQRRAMHCNDLQCDATTCNAVQRGAMHCKGGGRNECNVQRGTVSA